MAESGSREPLGREIWHTALGSHQRREYRSAIILAVNAAEVGLKQYIAIAVPESAWFVMNATAPPIRKLIVDYLPKLPGVDQDHLPEKSVRSVLHAAVQRRNTLVHVGMKTDDPKSPAR